MCGIVGSVAAKNQNPDWIRESTLCLSHRGPDDSGWVRLDEASLGMTRLAIVDIQGGTQPFASPDQRFVLVFNGQIYNYKTLRLSLEKQGHRFKSDSDTEVILIGFIEYGVEVVHHLEGMFAFAIWDQLERSLFIARDKFGEKPLSYSLLNSGGIIFASEIKALLTHPELSRQPDLESIQLMLNFGYVPSPKSAFKDVKKLPPGNYLTWKHGELQVIQYWTPQTRQIEGRSENELLKELDSLLINSVELRMNSDRGIGAWLSGGVDSSLVTYYMSQLQMEPVETFSAGFESKSFDESEFSTEVSKFLKTKHNPILINKGIESSILGIVDQLDEPFADSSFVATYLLSEFTREKRVVVLGGDGGDEAFGGYERYRLLSLLNQDGFNRFIFQGLSGLVSKLPPLGFLSNRLGRAQKVVTSSKDPFTQYEGMMTWVQKSQIQNLLLDSYSQNAEKWFSNNINASFVKQRGFEFAANLWDIRSYLPGDLLPKVDIASMSFGVEVRSPFLDSNVMGFGLSLPDEYRIRPTDTKYLLKKLARTKLPHSIVDRPKKGFGIPRDEWLRGQLKPHLEHSLSTSNKKLAELLDMKAVQACLESFTNGRSGDTEIWALYMLGNWADRWL